jgi:amino-acid N-acetyltransferase
MDDIRFAPAVPKDLGEIRNVLSALGLPADDVGAPHQTFLTARSGDALVGFVGLELYGLAALLRSLAVVPTRHGEGLGRDLARRALAEAEARGVRDVFLLTTTAERFFERSGFARVEREHVPEPIRESPEFKSLCPANAVCMMTHLVAGAGAVAAEAEPTDERPQRVRVREFAPADIDRALALWRSCEGIVLRDADDRREPIARYLERNPGLSFVCEVGAELAGAVLCGTDGRRGFLHHLAVAPAHRQRGLGRALALAAVEALSREGIDKCHLMVMPSNSAARFFWRRLGWEDRTDVLLMSRLASRSRGL